MCFASFRHHWALMILLTLEPPVFTYMWIFSILYFSSYDFLNNIFSFSYFIVRIQYIIHITYKICVNPLFVVNQASSQQ